jgi:tetratricopeptide (TPR) repeat protein
MVGVIGGKVLLAFILLSMLSVPALGLGINNSTVTNGNSTISPNSTGSNSIMNISQKVDSLDKKAAGLIYQGKYISAMKTLDEAIGLDSNDTYAWTKKGIVFYNQAKYNESLQAFDKLIKLKPEDTNVKNDKGIVLIAMRKYDEAIKVFNEVIELDPDNGKAYYNEGIAFKAIGNTTASDAAFANFKDLGISLGKAKDMGYDVPT